MRIGIFLEHIPPASGGGYTFQRELLKTFVELHHNSRHSFSIFLDSRNLREFAQDPKLEGIKKIPYQAHCIPKMLGKIGRRFNIFYLDKFGTVEKLALKNKIDFMWFLTPAPYPLDIPYMTVVWDLQHRLQPWFPEVSKGMDWQNREALNSTVLKRASVIITGNAAGKKEIKEFYGINEERIRLLPHPPPQINLPSTSQDNHNFEILQKYGIQKNSEYLFYPAQFWPHKNHANLLFAIKLLKEKYALSLSIAFSGSDKGNEAYIKNLAQKLGLENQTFFLGFVPAEHLAVFYKQAVALTYMSFFGPENLPPLEAFQCQCPVIASDVSGAREQFGEAALYANPQDPEAIALAIKSVYQDGELRKKLILNGQARVQHWTSKDFVQQIFNIFTEFETIRRCWNHSGES